MSERFDELSRTVAEQMPRRRLLRTAGVAVAGAAAATLLRPFKAEASCTVTCGAGETHCSPFFCCKKGESCSDPTGACCCPKGTAPCGTNCCSAGVACLDASQNICGCQKGTTPCGSPGSLTCCPAGTACGSPGCGPPSGNQVSANCQAVHSDVNLKEHLVPVGWD